MFIQLDCGCIGLLIIESESNKHFQKIIDCRDDWANLSCHQANSELDYHRYRMLNFNEIKPILDLLSLALIDADRFNKMQSILDLHNERLHELVKDLNNIFVANQTMKAIDTHDKPARFPFDDRLESEKQKEIEYLNRLNERS